jgi:hypothetical protein
VPSRPDEAWYRRFHDGRDRRRGSFTSKRFTGHESLQLAGAVDHEELVRVIGHLVQAPQIAQHHLERDVLADADHVEVHQRADRALLIGHRGPQLVALVGRKGLEDVLEHLARQVRRQIGDLVGIELAVAATSSSSSMCAIRLSRTASETSSRISPSRSVLTMVPDHQPLRARRALRGCQRRPRDAGYRGPSAARRCALLHQALDELLARALLPLDEALHQLMLAQELGHPAAGSPQRRVEGLRSPP